MHSSHSRLATTISVGLLVAAACTSAATPAPDVMPTASPSITITPAAASPTAAATPASPSPSATPQPTPEPTPVPVPPKPTGVTFDQERRWIDDGPVGEVTQRVTWRAPRSEGIEIRVYGVTECIAEPADPPPGTGGPCLVVHTPVPSRAAFGPTAWSAGRGRRCSLTAASPSSPPTPPGPSTARSCWLPTAQRATRSLPSHSLANGGGRLMVLATSSAETSCATSCALLWKREKHKDSSGRPVGLSGRETTGVHFMAGGPFAFPPKPASRSGPRRGPFREPRHIIRSRRPPWRLRTGAGAPGSGHSRSIPAQASQLQRQAMWGRTHPDSGL